MLMVQRVIFKPGVGVGTNKVQGSSSTLGCDSELGSGEAGRRLAMNRFDHVPGWFSDNKLWIEFIVATFLLWLLMMTAISELDLRSAG
jgi:hypothetical protein